MAELPHIGKQCSVDSCKQLDFLPFECDGCAKIYCLEHRTKDGHSCTQSCVPANAVEYTGPKGFTCSLGDCKNRELTPILCSKCDKSFCLSHRHQKDHQCEKLDTTPPTESKTSQHVKQILAAKGKIAPPKHRGAKNPKTAAKVALMKLKMHAVGEKGIPDCERVHLSVQLPQSRGDKPMFFSKIVKEFQGMSLFYPAVKMKWTIGRIIDYAASTAGIPNFNNTGAEKKLRLFVSDSGLLLPVDQALESILDGEAQLYNGSSVILECVSPDCHSVYDLPS